MHCPAFIANNNIWVSLVVGGLANGFLYALIALGYTLVYGVLAADQLRPLRGRHGRRVRRPVRHAGRPRHLDPAGFWAIGFMLIGILAGAAAGGATAFVLERVAYRPLRKRNAPQAHLPDQRHRRLLLPLQPRGQGVRALHGVHPDAAP